MKLSIKQSILMEHLNYVIKGISSKNLIPILNCIKFELSNEGLYLMSTDNDIAIKTFISKEKIDNIDICGEIVVSGKYIYEIIKKLPNEIINIEEVMESKIYINTSNSSFNLNCNNASDFPQLELEDNKNPIIISKNMFKSIINQTLFATSSQESRPALTGLNFKIENNILECVATDSYRLAKKIINLDDSGIDKVNIIIPTKNLYELVRLFNDDEGNLELHIFNNKVIFKFNSIIMMSRLINGSYPDTSKLIPTSFEISMKVKLNDLYYSIDRASLLTNESDKNTIKLESSSGFIKLTSNIPEIGNVVETVPLIEGGIDGFRIAFSSKYMMDALKSFEGEEVELLFNGEVKPIILKDPNNDSLIQLILPIRTY
ncbi:MAG: DNA polymerase III subunit beta [Bacilli bacterium]|nr:DNA polymerase III subunit beta [Bacilli bacterium]